MQDILQQALESFAIHNAVAGQVMMFCAAYLVFVMGAIWLGVALWRHERLTWAAVMRFVVIVVVAYAAAKVLNHVVLDTRPYLVTHTQPLISVSRDNGFPSDHVLLAAAMTATLWWLDRRVLLLFALGTLLVMAGRLGVGAHHTLDVAGSVVIVAVVTLLAAAIPLPSTWHAPILGGTVRRVEPAARRSA
jgi:membrane-associated phospholipid phosphatase